MVKHYVKNSEVVTPPNMINYDNWRGVKKEKLKRDKYTGQRRDGGQEQKKRLSEERTVGFFISGYKKKDVKVLKL